MPEGARSIVRRILRRVRRSLDRARPAATPDRERADLAREADLHRILGDALFGLAARDGQLTPLPQGPEPLSRATLERHLDDLAWHLQDLFTPFETGTSDGEHAAQHLAEGAGVLSLPPDLGSVQCLRARNDGETQTGPFAWVASGEDLSGLAAIARQASGGAETDWGRAHAILRFVRDRRYHGPPPTRSRDDPEAADPVSFFNGYGYGLCGNAANVMAVLCHASGIESRVVNLSGHTLVELSIDAAWHCFDPDAATAYVDPQRGPHPLSLKQLSSRAADVVGRLHLDACWSGRREELTALLARTEGHRVVATGASLAELVSGDGFRDRLRPGEEIALFHHSTGPWRPSERLLPAPFSPPAELSHARATWDLTHPGALACAEARGIAPDADGLRAEAGATLILQPGLAGPLLDAQLDLGSREACENLSVEVYEDDAWQPLQWDAPRDGSAVSLRRALVRSPGRRAKLRFERAVRIPRLTLVVLGQRGRRALPRFAPGDNPIRLEGAGSDSAQLEVALAFERTGKPTQEPVPLTPEAGTSVRLEDLGALVFGGQAGCEHEVQVSATADFESSLASNLDRIVPGTQLDIGDAERAFLPAGEVFWRVRRAGRPGRLAGPWSPTASFRVPMSSVYVRNVNRVLDAGLGHYTLGTRRLDGDWFDESGLATADWLAERGVVPGVRCIEVGCGSLRVGRHLIDRLAPGDYVGLDLTDRFYQDALADLDPAWLAARKPRFGVLAEDTIRAFEDEGCDFVVSLSVVMHVPEPELDGYFANIARLLGKSGTAFVSYKEMEAVTQTGAMTWGLPAGTLLTAASRAGLTGEVLEAPRLAELAGYEADARLRVLRLELERADP